jgi:hypothetical protein
MTANSASTVTSVISAEQALAAALPTGDIDTDAGFERAVFGLARRLKGVPELRGRPAADLRPLVRRWHEQAAGRLKWPKDTAGNAAARSGRRWSAVDAYAEFARAWKAARGDDAVKLAWASVSRQPLPPEADVYDERIGRLVALCRELQRQNELSGRGDQFFLSGYTVARLFDVSQPTAAKWLNMLVEDGVLEIIETAEHHDDDALVADDADGHPRDKPKPRHGHRMARTYRMASPGEPRDDAGRTNGASSAAADLFDLF